MSSQSLPYSSWFKWLSRRTETIAKERGWPLHIARSEAGRGRSVCLYRAA